MYTLVYICVVCIVYTFVAFAYVVHLPHTHTDIIVDLLIISTMNICVSVAFVLFFFMLNDIKS